MIIVDSYLRNHLENLRGVAIKMFALLVAVKNPTKLVPYICNCCFFTMHACLYAFLLKITHCTNFYRKQSALYIF